MKGVNIMRVILFVVFAASLALVSACGQQLVDFGHGGGSARAPDGGIVLSDLAVPVPDLAGGGDLAVPDMGTSSEDLL